MREISAIAFRHLGKVDWLPISIRKYRCQELFTPERLAHAHIFLFYLLPQELSYLGHHPPPSNEIGFNLLTCLLLQSYDGLEQTIEMVICAVVELLEGIEAFGKVCSELWWVVVSDRRVVEEEFMCVVVWEAGDFLFGRLVCSVCSRMFPLDVCILKNVFLGGRNE